MMSYIAPTAAVSGPAGGLNGGNFGLGVVDTLSANASSCTLLGSGGSSSSGGNLMPIPDVAEDQHQLNLQALEFAQRGSKEGLLQMLPQLTCIDADDGKVGALIHYAAMLGWDNVMHVLLTQKNDLIDRKRIRDGATPFLNCCALGGGTGFEMCLQRGCDVTARDNAGRGAVWYGLTSRFDPTWGLPKISWVHTLVTTYKKYIPEPQSAVAVYEMVNAAEEKGFTPLMLTAFQGFYNETQALLYYKANPNARDKYGNTALMYTCRVGAIEDDNDCVGGRAPSMNDSATVQELLTHGADPNLRNVFGKTALMLALERPSNGWPLDTQLLRVLLTSGADLFLNDPLHGSPFAFALKFLPDDDLRFLGEFVPPSHTGAIMNCLAQRQSAREQRFPHQVQQPQPLPPLNNSVDPHQAHRHFHHHQFYHQHGQTGDKWSQHQDPNLSFKAFSIPPGRDCPGCDMCRRLSEAQPVTQAPNNPVVSSS